MRTDITMIAGIALMALPAPGNTAGAADPESAAAAAPYAIAGAKLMMTSDQVAAALKGSGFRPEGAVMDQASFEDQLQARLTGKGRLTRTPFRRTRSGRRGRRRCPSRTCPIRARRGR